MPPQVSRRRFLAGASGVIALGGLAGCAAPSATATSPKAPAAVTTKKKNLVFAQQVQITSLDTAGGQPQVYPAGYEAAFAVYSGLIQFNRDLTFIPDLAKSWNVASDELTWTFSLRSGVSFQDGTPFNADAVVYYFTRMLSNTYNLAAYTLWEPIDRIVKVDDYTVSVITKRPYGALLNTIAHCSALIPSPAALAKYGQNIGLHPVGTGPYQMTSFNPGNQLVVKANQHYYGAKPIYDSITYTYVGDDSGRMAALQSGQADIIDSVPVQQASQVATNSSDRLINLAGLQVFGIGLNQTNTILTDPTIRQALNYAVDTEAIVSRLFNGYATELTSPLAPGIGGYTNCGSYPYSVSKAKQLLRQAGCTAGPDGVLAKDGRRLSFRLRTPNGLYPNDAEVAQAIQAQLQSVGIAVTIQEVDKSTFWDGITVPRNKVDFDLVLFGYNPSHASAALQLGALYTSNPSPTQKPSLWNFNWYHNSTVDTLIQQVETAVDQTQQYALLARAQHEIWGDAPYIWLYASSVLTAYDNQVATPLVLPTVFTLPSRLDQ